VSGGLIPGRHVVHVQHWKSGQHRNETSTCVLLLADEHSVDIGRTHLIGNGLKNVPITGFDYH
jgi:hypothetical protein